LAGLVCAAAAADTTGCTHDHAHLAVWSDRVLLYTKSNAAAKKERILVVTNFRVFTVKQGLMQRSVRAVPPMAPCCSEQRLAWYL